MTDRTMTPSKAREREHEAPEPASYYWLPRSKVYHLVQDGSMTVCGLAVEPGPGHGRKVWQWTTFRPLKHRICYKCLYPDRVWPWGE